jgi:cell division protein FtsL
VLGLLAALRSLARHRALDRLIAGRTWIVLIAFALIGIVTLQLLVLKLNAGIGRALVQEAQLQRENAALSIESSELAAGERVESQAARLGMELVPVGALRFLAVDPRADVARAAAALSTPVHASSPGSGEAGAGSGEASTAPAEASAGSAGEGDAGASVASAGAGAPAAEQSPVSTATVSPSDEAAASSPASAGATASGAAEAAPATAAAPVTAAPTAGGTQSTGAG